MTTNDDALTWFAVFRAATESGDRDRDLAGLARKELEGLGYCVMTLPRPANGPNNQEGAAHA